MKKKYFCTIFDVKCRSIGQLFRENRTNFLGEIEFIHFGWLFLFGFPRIRNRQNSIKIRILLCVNLFVFFFQFGMNCSLPFIDHNTNAIEEYCHCQIGNQTKQDVQHVTHGRVVHGQHSFISTISTAVMQWPMVISDSHPAIQEQLLSFN